MRSLKGVLLLLLVLLSTFGASQMPKWRNTTDVSQFSDSPVDISSDAEGNTYVLSQF